MIYKKLILAIFCILFLGKISAQTVKVDEHSFYKDRISKAPQSVFEKFIDNDIRLAFVSQSEERPNQCSVTIDQVSGGYMGIKYLHSLGHKKILWLAIMLG